MIPHSRPEITEEAIAAAVAALRRRHLAQGPEVAALETHIAAGMPGMHVAAVSSGTAALYLALISLGVGRGDRVVIPSFTCNSLFAAVCHAGARPVLADLEPGCICLTAAAVKRVLDADVKAIIAPHTCGYLAETEAIRGLGIPVIEDCAQCVGAPSSIESVHKVPVIEDCAQYVGAPSSIESVHRVPVIEDCAQYVGAPSSIESVHRVPVIEDCAQCAGASADGSPVGSKGDLAVFSFYACKFLPAGEGGVVVSRDEERIRLIKKLRDCDEHDPDPRAFNFKLTDVAAALAGVALAALPAANARRAVLADSYDLAFPELSWRRRCLQPQAVCFRYLLQIKPGLVKDFIQAGVEAGINCRKPVWKPLHLSLGGQCPVTDALFDSLVSVPLYPGLSNTEAAFIRDNLPAILSGF